MSAELIATLANMALAEVGSEDRAWPESTAEVPSGIGGSGGRALERAVFLAKLKVQGPDALTTCRVHSYHGLHGSCGRVTVAEALLGRTCHKAMS